MKISDFSGSAGIAPATTTIVLVDKRSLERECFVRGVEAMFPMIRVEAFARLADWAGRPGDGAPAAAILYNVGGRRIAEKSVADEIAALEQAARPAPVIVLSPFEDLSEMIAALDCGARGYIPDCLGMEATLTAVQLAGEGAVFLPAATVLALRYALGARNAAGADDGFTDRQAAVAERLRRGKPNKVIAYELNMCESTVKVHIRNIMKKLRVTNRTEAGFRLNALLAEPDPELDRIPPADRHD